MKHNVIRLKYLTVKLSIVHTYQKYAEAIQGPVKHLRWIILGK